MKPLLTTKRLIITCSVLVAGGLVLFGLLSWVLFADRQVYLTGLAQYKGLPQEASDIRVFRNENISGTFCTDFAISEEAFRVFAASQGWTLREISGEEMIITAEARNAGRQADWHRISRGLWWSQRAPNGGGVTAAYDRGTGRAWIDSSAR